MYHNSHVRPQRAMAEDLTIRALGTIEDRGRNRIRNDSPPPFQDSDRAASHSPDFQFYHTEITDDPKVPLESFYLKQDEAPDTYRYLPLDTQYIRLLRISPSSDKLRLYGVLKSLPLETIKAATLEFQALSYAWAHDDEHDYIFLSDALSGTLDDHKDHTTNSTIAQETPHRIKIHKHLANALKRIREPNAYTWIWVDALCIDQKNEQEKSHQIPKMPDIYANAWNVIVWLGEPPDIPLRAKKDVEDALKLIPKLLNLGVLETMLQSDDRDYSVVESWISFMDILQLPWFRRRWVRDHLIYFSTR